MSIPRAVWALGFVSLLMDSSTELIQSLLPVFVVVGLGATAATLGLLEGVAEATSLALKAASGAWSDRLGRRLPLTVAGYGIAAGAKLLFPFAQGIGLVFGARAVDRIGKGLRGAPRDALVAELTPEAARGAAYGMRQALDTVGAVLGPLLALILMAALHGDFRAVFAVACVPAFLSVAVLCLGVREPVPHRGASAAASGASARSPADWEPAAAGASPARSESEAAGAPPARPESESDGPPPGRSPALGPRLWGLVAIAAALGFARISEAFLLLDGERLGLPVARVPLVLLTMNVTYAASAYPSGAASDRMGRSRILGLGIATLLLADLVLRSADSAGGVLFGSAIWGLHLGLTQGTVSALVSDEAPAARRGAAFGWFHMLTGLASLLGNVAAGWTWDRFGPGSAFTLSAGFALVAGAGLFVWSRIGGSEPRPAIE